MHSIFNFLRNYIYVIKTLNRACLETFYTQYHNRGHFNFKVSVENECLCIMVMVNHGT